MAKKFSKFLLFTAAVSAAGAAAYYVMQKKDSILSKDADDEDYDDFSGKSEDADISSRTYVPLNHDNAVETEDAEPSAAENDFTPLSEQAEQAAQTEESVEEFFDESDSDEEDS